MANVNPHLHFPIADEVRRQLDLGAAALKLHPVHGGFRCDDRGALPGLPGARRARRAAGRALRHQQLPGLDERAGRPRVPAARRTRLPDAGRRARPRRPRLVVRRRRRSWRWRTRHVWIELSGLPPKRLPDYYARFDLGRLARKWIFAHRLAGRARHGRRTPAPSSASASTTSAPPPCSGGNALRVYSGVGRETIMSDAAELSDEELAAQGKQLHDSRNWVFLHGTAAQFETHTRGCSSSSRSTSAASPSAPGRAPPRTPPAGPSPTRWSRCCGRWPRHPAAGCTSSRCTRRPGLVGLDRAALARLYTAEPKLLRHRQAGPGDHRRRAGEVVGCWGWVRWHVRLEFPRYLGISRAPGRKRTSHFPISSDLPMRTGASSGVHAPGCARKPRYLGNYAPGNRVCPAAQPESARPATRTPARPAPPPGPTPAPAPSTPVRAADRVGT